MLNAAPTAESYMLLAADAAERGRRLHLALRARYAWATTRLAALITVAWTQQVCSAVFRLGIHDPWAVGNPPKPPPFIRPWG